MIRTTLACLAVLSLAAAPAMAQSTKPVATPAQTTAAVAAEPAPGSAEWLRMRSESYEADQATDAEQDPAELAATIKLNSSIVAGNAAAERSEVEAQAAFEAQNERWRAENARSNTARAEWEANVAAADSARARWERERAAWEAEVAACRASGRVCITPDAPK
ncbi:cell wall hydrolase [Brevundimonas lenta]|uniref:Cell wall hydrolase n=1 Tax=Brevundimonas lenta TaxID=424796 RepID=A0A7W6NRJ8_9CAUL|nr:cell wall hydrolase [Brevundimonas lenta]MBB4084260.1 hypothetical protein [Brevundimonas lenta]